MPAHIPCAAERSNHNLAWHAFCRPAPSLLVKHPDIVLGYRMTASGCPLEPLAGLVHIAATVTAGRNRFSSGSLSSLDLANHSHYRGRSLGIGAGNQSGLSTMAEKDSAGSSLGYGHDSDSQSSRTRSGIGTSNIHLTDAAAQQAHTGHSPEQAAAVYTELRLGTADGQAGYLDNRFDAGWVKNKIDLQTSVSQKFAPIAAQGVAAASDYLVSTQKHQHAQMLTQMLKNLLEAELQQNHSEAEKAELRADLNRINQYLADNQAAYEL